MSKGCMHPSIMHPSILHHCGLNMYFFLNFCWLFPHPQNLIVKMWLLWPKCLFSPSHPLRTTSFCTCQFKLITRALVTIKAVVNLQNKNTVLIFTTYFQYLIVVLVASSCPENAQAILLKRPMCRWLVTLIVCLQIEMKGPR